jgi:hypothetical protein
MSFTQDGIQNSFGSLKAFFSGQEFPTPRIGVTLEKPHGDLSDIGERNPLLAQCGPGPQRSPFTQSRGGLSKFFSAPMTEQKSASIMKNFMNANSGGGLTRSQMQSIADTGEFNGEPVSGSVRKAAQKMMDNGGELFDKLDSSNKPWEKDGFVANSDIDVAQQNNTLKGSPIQQLADALKQLFTPPMTEQNAADTIKQYMQNNGDGLTKDQVAELAQGYIVKNGQPTRVDDKNVQQAAQKLMANGGALFDKLESANKPWEKDGFLAIVDVNVATQNDELSKGGLSDLLSKIFSRPMSDRKAANILGNFAQTQSNGGLNEAQLNQLAQGFFVKNGEPMRVDKDVKDAASKLLSDEGSKPWERFKAPTIVININMPGQESKTQSPPFVPDVSRLAARHQPLSFSSQGADGEMV